MEFLGEGRTLGKGKVYLCSEWKNEMPAIHHVSSLEHDNWINPIE